MALTEVDQPFHLSGNYAPVREEVTAFDLAVEGAIPRELDGLYVRNGPNPMSGSSAHWFLGDGMLHGVSLREGGAEWYRNRWIRTRALEGAQLIDMSTGAVDYTVAVANTHVIPHAGKILALVESSFPTVVTPELETVGVSDYQGRLTTAMTAHPKRCPVTDELHFFGYGFFPPYLTYHRADPAGNLVQSEVIDVPGPTMMHDFNLTDRSVIFMDLPVVFDLELAMAGTMPYRWSDDYGARLGVMPRGGTAADVRWYEVDPCYVFHPMNAWEEDGRIVIDVARYSEVWRGDPSVFGAVPMLHRWTIDQAAGTVREETLDDRGTEFPRVDDRLTGLRARYGYAKATEGGGLVRYDLHTGAAEVHDFGTGRLAGEGVFAPAGPGETDGYLLTYVYDEARDGSDFVVLAADDFTGEPVATVRLPQRVPFGFHGSWIPRP